MKVAVFFVSLCFLLLEGYISTHHKSTGYIPTEHIEETQQVKRTNTNQYYTVNNYNNLHKKEEAYFFYDDIEEEDQNNLFIRKYRLLAKCYLTLSCLFILRYLYNCFKARLTFYCPLSSYKYITQRVLRI